MKSDELPAEWHTKPSRQVSDGKDSAASEGKRKGPLPSSEGRQR
jgi:hypothetical protein